MKRIMFFLPSLAGGGAEKVLVNLVNNLDKEKYEITIMCLFDVGINKQFLHPNIEYKYIFKHLFIGNTHLLKLFPANFLYRIMIHEHYDIVVSFFQSPTTRIVAGCKEQGTKLIQWIHNEFHDTEKIAMCYQSIEECIALQKRFDATVYVSETVKEIYLDTFPEIRKKDIVLYNVVESDIIRTLSQEVVQDGTLFDADYTLISVGRLVPQKAFDRLLSVVKRVKDKNINVKLLLLGVGELEGALRKRARDLKLGNSVEFLGYQKNPYKYVKQADLFVCSSLYEGFSTAVTEALIVGTPVITTLCSGMKELLGANEYGMITENSEDALFEGVWKLLEEKETLAYYKMKAEERGLKFNTKQTTLAIECFFDEL